MKRDLFALRAKGELGGLLAAAVVLCAPGAAAADPGAGRAAGEERQGGETTGRDAARAGSDGDHRGAGTTWATYRPRGWSAGIVTRGTGYLRAGGSERVRDVQRDLRKRGLRPGPVDGLFGPRTEAAVEKFQRRHGLAVDGVVGAETLSTLRRESGPGDEHAASRRRDAQRDDEAAPAPASAADAPSGAKASASDSRSADKPHTAGGSSPSRAPATVPSPADRPAGGWFVSRLPRISDELLLAALAIAVVLFGAVALARMRGSRRSGTRRGYDPPSQTMIPITYLLEVAGVSDDEKTGKFAGFVYSIALTRGLEDAPGRAAQVHAMALREDVDVPEELALTTELLVNDPSRAAPVWVRLSEIQRIRSDREAAPGLAAPTRPPAPIPDHHRRARAPAERPPASRAYGGRHDGS